ncbi:hypothetical protein P389DRAFT_195161 [Cystobasidium minutum MCA 4210]|uniref:uncharacterized protein n=1 Tax=Cystobasidium minutum MCA 4210 TaxID=1397322 RepID=UPI0034CD9F07|eukprot:jgi/Rhomi1/195161/gm1.3375_g
MQLDHRPTGRSQTIMSNASDNEMTFLRSKILDMVNKRDFPKTCCPSEVARALSTQELKELDCADWRAAMEPIRREAYKLYAENLVHVTQKGEEVGVDKLDQIKGPIRLRKPS